MRFHIQNMVCDGCTRSVARSVRSAEAEARIEADPRARALSVSSDKAREAFLTALEAASFPAAPH